MILFTFKSLMTILIVPLVFSNTFWFKRCSEVKIMKIEKTHFLCCLGSDKVNRQALASIFEASSAQQPFKV